MFFRLGDKPPPEFPFTLKLVLTQKTVKFKLFKIS